ncbi:MAG: hypothetical protein K1W34_02830 [Lachnospiraceae bacterium]
MRTTTNYKDISCNGYEVIAAQGRKGRFVKKYECLFMFRKNEHEEYIPIKEMNGKAIISVRANSGHTTDTHKLSEFWVINGFEVLAGALLLHLYNPYWDKADTAYLMIPDDNGCATYHFVTCACTLFFNHFNRFTQQDAQYSIETNWWRLEDENIRANKIHIDISEDRGCAYRKYHFCNIVEHGEEKRDINNADITERTDF